ncbi:helix-turn-helix transcriptional regulator [Brevundimonas staleyi]|uniref:Helix-turn-helix transcriptional regulator n=1 Tax=Brevundimonas staleyi TaxID=74326 RepID=A0ABW0FY14_9CAUL
MSRVNGPTRGEVIALVLPTANNAQVHIDHSAPLSHPGVTSDSPIVRPSVLETVAIQFVSGPVSAPAPDLVKPESTLPTLPGWPAMLSRSQLCAYLGVSWSTLKGTLTVHPIDLGASVIRYSRAQIDEWIETRPPKIRGGGRPLIEAPESEPVPDERLTALERVRRRADRR